MSKFKMPHSQKAAAGHGHADGREAEELFQQLLENNSIMEEDRGAMAERMLHLLNVKVPGMEQVCGASPNGCDQEECAAPEGGASQEDDAQDAGGFLGFDAIGTDGDDGEQNGSDDAGSGLEDLVSSAQPAGQKPAGAEQEFDDEFIQTSAAMPHKAPCTAEPAEAAPSAGPKPAGGLLDGFSALTCIWQDDVVKTICAPGFSAAAARALAKVVESAGDGMPRCGGAKQLAALKPMLVRTAVERGWDAACALELALVKPDAAGRKEIARRLHACADAMEGACNG